MLDLTSACSKFDVTTEISNFICVLLSRQMKLRSGEARTNQTDSRLIDRHVWCYLL